MWISSGVARDLNDLRRVHQLLVSSLQKLTHNSITSNSFTPSTLTDQILTSIGGSAATNSNKENCEPQLIYSELSLTVEKLAVLRAWADVYIVAQMKAIEKIKSTKTNQTTSGSCESLLNLVQPELSILSYHWSVALKDYAFLCLPSDYSNQLPIEGGAFYHADLVESSKPIYREHFTKILLAYSIWLNEIKFDIKELPANQKLFQPSTQPPASPPASEEHTKKLKVQKEKLFFMLLGLSLETLSNKTGLAQLTDETIENILESIDNLLRTSLARRLLLNKQSGICLCVEILSILYKVKLTRDIMSINLLIIKIVEQINEIRLSPKEEIEETLEQSNNATSESKVKRQEKNTSALIFVILEICMRDLIKYLPNLLSSAKVPPNTSAKNKASFLYMHVNSCKELKSIDVELISNVISALNSIPFYPDIILEKRISLISIIYHILFNLLQAINSLMSNKTNSSQLESTMHSVIFNSFKQICSTSSSISKWNFQFCDSPNDASSGDTTSQSLIKSQQSALLSTLLLQNVNKETIMRLLSIFFQYCSMKVFEPLNVYEKCKVFMCSMRCSDSLSELLCLIQSLNDILNNNQTKKELRVILLKEHLSYLLKITSSSTAYVMPSTSLYHHGNNSYKSEAAETEVINFLSIRNDDSLQLIKSILDLLESMVNLLSDDESLKVEHETLTIFIHILSMYLNDPADESSEHHHHADLKIKRLTNELNDLVLKKLLCLGVKYKQEFKQVLDKWPNLKSKIGNAFKTMNANSIQSQSQTSAQNQMNSANQVSNKAPKIQLNFNFSKFK
jgi:hypothetical protein